MLKFPNYFKSFEVYNDASISERFYGVLYQMVADEFDDILAK